MLARRCRGRAFAAAGPLVLLALVFALLALSSSGPVAAYDDGQCESHVYPLDGSTLKPVSTPSPVADLTWAGAGPEDADRFVFAVTEPTAGSVGGRLFWSDDRGRDGSWKDITDRLPGAFDEPPSGAPSTMRGVVDVHWGGPLAPETVLVQGAGGFHWLTKDAGRTFARAATPGEGTTVGWWAELKAHPHNPAWILSKSRRPECHGRGPGGGPGGKWCAFDLFATKDHGLTWQNLTQNSKGRVASFWDFDWGASLKKHDQGAAAQARKNPDSADPTVLATAYESKNAMKGAYPGWDVDLHFISSDSWFARPHQKVAACGNQIEVVGEMLYVATPAGCPTHPDGRPRAVPRGAGASNVVLYTSADAGRSFAQACLPSRDLDLGYSLLRTHDERAALLVVDHDEQEPAAAAAPVGNVYAPGGGDAAGAFSLSLPRAYRAFQASDVARVEGLPGVWLANQLDEDAMLGGGGGQQRRPPRGDGARGHPSSSSSGSGRGGLGGSDRYSERVRTRVTFNGGGEWKDLSPPRHFTHAACARCTPSADSSSASADPNCALHLHGPSSWHDGPSGRPAFYSHASAPGVVMAVGNAGPHLDSAADSLCTWLSRDGGRTWADVAPRASIYEFGNSGGIILSARHEADGPTDTISFSADGGHCFHEIRLSEAIDVQNIRVEPDGAAHVFVVHGKACRVGAHQGCTWEGASGGSSGGTGGAGTRTFGAPGRMFVVDVKSLVSSSSSSSSSSDSEGGGWRECQKSDYEEWHPAIASGGGPGGCLLGADVSVRRKIPGTHCFNRLDGANSGSAAAPGAARSANTDGTGVAPTADPSKFPKCQCTSADVECEFGYEPVSGLGQLLEDAFFFGGIGETSPLGGGSSSSGGGGGNNDKTSKNKRCVKVPGFDDRSACPLLAERGYRASSTGLRLVHDDVCTGVAAVIPDTDGKGGGKGRHWSGGGGGGGFFKRGGFLHAFAATVASFAALALLFVAGVSLMRASAERGGGVDGAVAALGAAAGAALEAGASVVERARATVGGGGGGGRGRLSGAAAASDAYFQSLPGEDDGEFVPLAAASDDFGLDLGAADTREAAPL